MFKFRAQSQMHGNAARAICGQHDAPDRPVTIAMTSRQLDRPIRPTTANVREDVIHDQLRASTEVLVMRRIRQTNASRPECHRARLVGAGNMSPAPSVVLAAGPTLAAVAVIGEVSAAVAIAPGRSADGDSHGDADCRSACDTPSAAPDWMAHMAYRVR